ncbi:hypothetical protein QR680_008610 [Steinernema hermaphroditum]|uniref:Uncharacterized protein n=1 Tax=Steinernema hermaphroditum TaxID=289476 RepID=A0AA39M7Z0_9BILA|nr:hypothetical protein QR680_008610 [Steinernema hermaphroditum]
MSRFIKWLLLQQDQSSVSYSRFGMPGEEQDDRPRPTTILVPKFEENHRDFLLCGKVHCEKAASCSAIFGLSMVIIIFISSFFEFDWYDHRRGVDIMALLGLLVYVFLGVMLHYYVILGIKRQAAYFLLPFIVGYLAVIASGCLLIITLIVHLVMHDDSMHPEQSNYNIRAPKKTVFLFFVVSVVVVAVQCFMLCAVVKCRYYLSRKEIHTTTMRVAQKSVTQNPDMRIVTLDKNGQQEEVRIPIPSVAPATTAATPSEPAVPAPNANSVTSFANPVASLDAHHTSVLDSADAAFGGAAETPEVRVVNSKINNGFDNPAHNPNA